MSVAFHFKTDDHKQYHLEPIDFIFQSLLVIGKENTRVHIGDIIIEAKELNSPYNIQFLRAWLGEVSLQTKSIDELKQSFAIFLTNISDEAEHRIHTGLAQTPYYLGKVKATQVAVVGTLHNILYDLSLPHYGTVNNNEFVMNFFEKDKGDYDKCMLDRIQKHGFTTRLAKYEELF